MNLKELEKAAEYMSKALREEKWPKIEGILETDTINGWVHIYEVKGEERKCLALMPEESFQKMRKDFENEELS